MLKKTSSRSSYVMMAGSYSTRTASACPVVPVQTCSYVGLGLRPPMYPDFTSSTPARSTKTPSRHQKQPPANMAVWVSRSLVTLFLRPPCPVAIVGPRPGSLQSSHDLTSSTSKRTPQPLPPDD